MFRPIGRPKKKRKRSKYENESFVKDGKLSKKGRSIACQSCGNIGHNEATCNEKGGNNAESSGSMYGQAQQAEPVVGQDGSGGSGVGAVIGLSAANGAGGAGVGVGCQDMGSNNKMEQPPPPPLENINFESDEESPLTLSQSAVAPAKQSFQSETATNLPKSKLFRKLHSTAFHSVYIVLFNAKINVLLPFGPLAVLLHYLTGWHGWVFFFSLLGITPLAERLSYATEQLACYIGNSGTLKGNQSSKIMKGIEQIQQPPMLSLLHQNVGVDEPKIISNPEQQDATNEKSDSPTSTLTRVDTPLDRIKIATLVSSDNLLDTPRPHMKCSGSTTQLEVNPQSEAVEFYNSIKLELSLPKDPIKLQLLAT
ncbi:hypothetical protein Tco_0528286 [Tanacetum coccineum]